MLPRPSFAHLVKLTDGVGLFEHARFTAPRRDHGYCTDDVGRGLLVVARQRAPSPPLERLSQVYLTFLERALTPEGRFRNRLTTSGDWLDEGDSDDAVGRALQGLGTAAASVSCPELNQRALSAFEAGSRLSSPFPRANAYAALGAAEVLAVSPEHPQARSLLEVAARRLGTPSRDRDFPWPEPRLTYANALLAEARIAAGVALEEPALLEEGLELLDWLVGVETREAQFSFTPVGGWEPGEPRPGFDQQPIEAAAMADACARAFDVTGAPGWAHRALRAARWFVGVNDVGLSLYDPESGGCRDGLEAASCNENQGAESTIMMISAFQQAQRVRRIGLSQAARRSAAATAAPSTIAAPTHLSAAP